MSSLPQFPGAESGDNDDVSWALETGRSMWAQGDQAEAIRWLKRAAEGAEEAGNDMRSVMLAKAAAELRTYFEEHNGPLSQAPRALAEAAQLDATPISAVPVARGPASSPSGSISASSARALGAMPPAPRAALPGARGDDVRTDKRPPPPPKSSHGGDPTSSASGPPPSMPEPSVPTPSVSAPSASAPPPASTPAPTTPRSQMPSPSAPPPSGPVDEDNQRPTLIQSPARFLPKAVKQTGRGAVDRQDAVRVLIQQVEGKPGMLLVRPLRPGDKPGPGTRAALLVSLDGELLFE